jgi:hypothetical protein
MAVEVAEVEAAVEAVEEVAHQEAHHKQTQGHNHKSP